MRYELTSLATIKRFVGDIVARAKDVEFLAENLPKKDDSSRRVSLVSEIRRRGLPACLPLSRHMGDH
jgi:hypothetical protein